ncbi:hypothetical protein, partial [Acinetobacter brisouii]|uniref:hypothetical protein n=1 Tax=Acinetobacter brisouii TaxID=396323 RepID=UPI00148F19B1
ESVNFKDCYSCIYQKSENIKNQNDIKYNGSALFSEHVNGSENLKVIRKTNFDNANLFIAAYSQGYTFEQCKFIDSILGLKDYWDQAREMKSCEFLKGDKNLGSTFEYLPDYKLDKLHLEAIEQQSSDSPKSNQQFFQ